MFESPELAMAALSNRSREEHHLYRLLNEVHDNRSHCLFCRDESTDDFDDYIRNTETHFKFAIACQAHADDYILPELIRLQEKEEPHKPVHSRFVGRKVRVVRFRIGDGSPKSIYLEDVSPSYASTRITLFKLALRVDDVALEVFIAVYNEEVKDVPQASV